MSLQSFVGPWPLFQFLDLYRVSRTPWTGDQPVARPLPSHRRTQAQNKRTQTSMPSVGFEPTIPAFKRAKTVHAPDLPATVVGMLISETGSKKGIFFINTNINLKMRARWNLSKAEGAPLHKVCKQLHSRKNLNWRWPGTEYWENIWTY
jgi:hypothetical protein